MHPLCIAHKKYILTRGHLDNIKTKFSMKTFLQYIILSGRIPRRGSKKISEGVGDRLNLVVRSRNIFSEAVGIGPPWDPKYVQGKVLTGVQGGGGFGSSWIIEILKNKPKSWNKPHYSCCSIYLQYLGKNK